jgi:hypothetical protein
LEVLVGIDPLLVIGGAFDLEHAVRLLGPEIFRVPTPYGKTEVHLAGVGAIRAPFVQLDETGAVVSVTFAIEPPALVDRHAADAAWGTGRMGATGKTRPLSGPYDDARPWLEFDLVGACGSARLALDLLAVDGNAIVHEFDAPAQVRVRCVKIDVFQERIVTTSGVRPQR